VGVSVMVGTGVAVGRWVRVAVAVAACPIFVWVGFVEVVVTGAVA
jgi:hypothetical protein